LEVYPPLWTIREKGRKTSKTHICLQEEGQQLNVVNVVNLLTGLKYYLDIQGYSQRIRLE